MAAIVALIDKDLSEPYSVLTYRYFVYNWSQHTHMAMYQGKCCGVVVSTFCEWIFYFYFLAFCFSSAVLWQCLMHAASHIFQSLSLSLSLARSLARALFLSLCLCLVQAASHILQSLARSLSLSWGQEARRMKERSSG